MFSIEGKTPRWSTQIASDLDRDGMCFELVDVRGEVVAEAFACDADNTASVTLWPSERHIPDEVLDWFLPMAFERLGKFEDGTPLPPLEEWPITRK
jgi:hypothetical protein